MSRAWMPDAWAAEGWRTPDTYSQFFEPLPSAPGLYLLVTLEWLSREQEIGYVGQAKDLSRRLKHHEICRLIRAKGFYVQRWFKCFALPELRETERIFIQKHNPPFNINGRLRGAA